MRLGGIGRYAAVVTGVGLLALGQAWGAQAGKSPVIEAQAAVANYDEFKNNVSYMETRDFYRAENVSPHRFRYHWNGNAENY